jgi:hypothetical protein
MRNSLKFLDPFSLNSLQASRVQKELFMVGGRHFKRDEEVKDDVKEWVKWTGGGGL